MQTHTLQYGSLSTYSQAELGRHLMLDLFDCPKEKISSLSFITGFLEKFPGEIDMHAISPAYVFIREEEGERGISGVILIAESHITVHTFPDKNMAFVDVFSTKEFDLSFVSNYLVNYFEAQKHEISKITT